MSIFIMAQIVGLIGIICGMITFHTKDMRGARKWKLTIDILWALHYLLLGALTGFGTSVIAACREIVFLNDHKKICQLKMWPWFFIVLNFISAAFTWKGIYSIFPAISSVLATFIFWQKDIRRGRVMCLVVNSLMFLYDVFAGSFMGMVTETLSFVSTLFAIYRFRKGKEQQV